MVALTQWQLVCALGLFFPAFVAAGDLTIALARVQGSGWEAQDIRVRANLGASPRAELQIKRLVGIGLHGTLDAVNVECKVLKLTARLIECPQVVVRGIVPS